MGTRGFAIPRFVTVVLVYALVSMLFPATVRAAVACTATTLVPTLGRSEVNQGLGSYDRLTRGKDVLLRLYLTLPPTTTCTLASGQAITIRSATLTI